MLTNTLGGRYFLHEITQKLSVLPCGRTQDVRCMFSRIVKGNYTLFPCPEPCSLFLLCDMTEGESYFPDSTTPSIFMQKNAIVTACFLELPLGWINKYHLLFSDYNNMYVRVK